MLQVYVPEIEYFDEKTSSFGKVGGCTLNLEHSLLSISKWEARWHKPYLESPGVKQTKDRQKTQEEMLDYIRCMCLDKHVDPILFRLIPAKALMQIQEYINDPMTATWFSEQDAKKSREVVTSEIIYYWMVALSIPFECQKWHLNRLLTLIRVCNIKQQPDKKMSKSALMKRNRALNAARRNRTGSRG